MALRARLEYALGERVLSPFTDLTRRVYESLLTRIPEIDVLTGGIPRGAITEIVGPVSSGLTSTILSILAEASKRDEVLALVDGNNAFDPLSGAMAGLDLRRLLWVRCRNLDQVLRSTDLLLQGGGFGLVAMDLTDIPRRQTRSIPLASWFRFQRTIEKTPTCLVIAGEETVAKSAASLALRLDQCRPNWVNNQKPPHTIFLRSSPPKADVVRLRSRFYEK